MQFDYKDPERGFDRKSVHGLVVRLVSVKDPSTATALEVSAGGKVSSHELLVGIGQKYVGMKSYEINHTRLDRTYLPFMM